MYNKCMTDLKANHRYQLINMAITCWKHLRLEDDEISGKIDSLEHRLDRATKKEFVAIFNEYVKRVNLIF